MSAREIVEGSCYNGLRWEIVDECLTISGSGLMEEFYVDSPDMNNWLREVYPPELYGMPTAPPWKQYDYNSVIIEKGVLNISDYAFSYEKKLESVELPDGLLSIGFRAFIGCNSLKTITIPGSVIDIKDSAFDGCKSLETITMHEGILHIGTDVFSDCKSLKSIIFPKSVKTIGKFNLPLGSLLELLVVPDNLQYDYRTFPDCDIIKNTQYFPTSIDNKQNGSNDILEDGYFYSRWTYEISTGNLTINGYGGLSNFLYAEDEYFHQEMRDVFLDLWHDYKIKKVVINGINCIGDSLFIDQSSLITAIISNGVKIIDFEAFRGCSSLKNINIPNSVESIRGGAFGDCSSLENILIPDSVSDIGWTDEYSLMGTFENCSSLKTIKLSNTIKIIPENTFKGCKSLKSITIPNSVKKIGNYAFKDCTCLETLDIPDSVECLGEGVFNNCPLLKQIRLPKHLQYGSYLFQEPPKLDYKDLLF